MSEEYIPSGVELVVKNIGEFLKDMSAATKAAVDFGAKVAQSAGSGVGHVKNFSDSISGIGAKVVGMAGTVIGPFQQIGSSILNLGKYALEAATIGVAALTAGFVGLGAIALQEYSKYERMATSIQSLVARDISQGQEVQQTRQVTAQLTKKEADELGGLAEKIHDAELARATDAAEIRNESEALRQLRDAHGEEALDVQLATAKLAEHTDAYNDSGKAIDDMKARMGELQGKSGQLVTVIDKVRVGQMSMTDAMEKAGPKAKELLNWITKLAVQSPFNEEGINAALKTALAYGFNVDQAKELVAAEVDYAAATGQGVEATNQISLALGQMHAKGKVSGQELIQLTNAGVGVNKILGDMGYTLDDVSAGLVNADDFTAAVIKDMNVFKGAAKDQAGTFSGLLSSLSDLKSIGLREFFAGTFKSIQPYLNDFVGFLTSAALETGSIRDLGDAFGQYVAGGLQRVGTFISKVQGAFSKFGVKGAGVSILGQLGFSQDTINQAGQFVSKLLTSIGKITSAFQKFGAKGVEVSLLGMLGFDPTTIATINSTISSIVTTITGFVTQVMAAVSNISFDAITGGIVGLGAVLAGGVFVALVAGILSLLTPINLIIAGAVLLGAAWNTNWMGIRDYTMQAWTAIQPVLVAIYDWLYANIPVAIAATSTFFTNTLMPALQAVGTFISTYVIPALSMLWTWLATNIPVAITKVSTFWTGTLMPAISAVGTWITGTLIPTLTELWTLLSDKIGSAVNTVSAIWSGTLQPALQTVGNYVNGRLVPFFRSIAAVLGAVLGKAVEALAGLWQNVLFPALQSVGNYVEAHVITPFKVLSSLFAESLFINLSKVGNFLKNTLVPAVFGMGKAVGQEAMPPVRKITEQVLPLFEKGLKVIDEVVQRLTDKFSHFAETVKNFSLPDVLTPGSPPPMAYALMDIGKAADGATTAMSGFNNSINSATIDTQYYTDLGTQLMKRIASGIGLAGGSIKANIQKQLGIFSAKFFKIKESGSSDFLLSEAERNNAEASIKKTYADLYDSILAGKAGADEFVAQFHDQLVGSMNTVELDKVTKKVRSQAQHIVDTIRSQFGPLTLQLKAQAVQAAQSLNSLAGSFADLLKGKMGNKDEAKQAVAKLVEDNTDLNKTYDAQQKKMQSLQAGLDRLLSKQHQDVTAIARRRQAISDLNMEMQDTQAAIAQNNQSFRDLAKTPAGLATVLGQFLKGKEESITLQQVDATGKLVDVTYSRVEAQTKLNALLAEQARQEALIAEQQKAQQQLDFLSQQLQLIKLGQGLGTNIFKGITFGLNASTEDMLKAVNAIVNAMVGQMDADLQIHSPSKVAAQKADYFMQGWIDRLYKRIPDMRDAVSMAFGGGSMNGAYLPRAGNTYNTTYSFPMQVNTAATAAGVVQQYEVYRATIGD